MCAAISGCASIGGEAGTDNKYDTAYLQSHLIPGKTTQADVRQMFGDPDNQMVVQAVGATTWTYSNSQANTAKSVVKNSAVSTLASMIPIPGVAGAVAGMSAASSSGGFKMLNIRFNNAGVLKDYSANTN